MKNVSKLFVLMVTLAMTAVVVADQPQLDVRGGVTYDFEALSKQRFQGIADGLETENLISNANFADNSPGAESDPFHWRNTYYYIHNPEAHRNPEERERKRARMREIIRWEINDGVASIIKPVQLREVCGPMVKDASAAWSKVVELPNTDGGTYQLTFKYQARHEASGNNYMLAVFRGEHENPLRGKETASARTFPFADVWGEWGSSPRKLSYRPTPSTCTSFSAPMMSASWKFRPGSGAGAEKREVDHPSFAARLGQRFRPLAEPAGHHDLYLEA